MKVITAIHQGYELYGSDRTFQQSLRALRDHHPVARLIAILPRPGQLSEALEADGFLVVFQDLWILRKSYGLGLVLRMLALPASLWRAHRTMAASDLVYVNTAVVADYLMAARFHCGKVVAHIHEIPTGFAHRLLQALVRGSRAALFFNSKATADVFASSPGVPRAIIHNGVPGPAGVGPLRLRGDGRLRVLMLGRINDWKGQDLLIEAIHRLPADQRSRVEVRVVGDAFGDQPHRSELQSQINRLGLAEQVLLEGFVADPSSHLEWSDVVVVPSRKPEPFGLVAIEAMAWGRPVVAAAHGGLTEIVEPGRTGRLFTPNNPDELSAALLDLIDQPEGLVELGAGGRRVFEARFTDEAFMRNFTAALDVVAGQRETSRG